MLKKIKNFIKYNSIGSIYLCLFLLSQSFAMIGVFIYNVYTNMEFQDKFIELLGPIYLDSNFNYLESYDEILVSYMNLFNDILLPILLISNVFITIILGIKIFASRKKETVIKKISIYEIFKYIAIGIGLNLIISIIISLLPTELIESHSTATEGVLNGAPLILLLSSGIFAPIAEELICRYGMQKNFVKINPVFGIIYQALVFGLLHGNLVQSTYAFVLGLIFGFIVYKKGNLLYSIILHIAINTSSVFIVILGINELLAMLGMLLISIILAVLFYFIFYKNKKDIMLNVSEEGLDDLNDRESN